MPDNKLEERKVVALEGIKYNLSLLGAIVSAASLAITLAIIST